MWNIVFLILLLTVSTTLWAFYCPNPWMQTLKDSKNLCSTIQGSRWVKAHLPPFKRHCALCAVRCPVASEKNSDQLTNMEKCSTCISLDNPQWKAGKILPEPLAQFEPDVTLEYPNATRKEKNILMGTPGHSLCSGSQLTSYIFGHIILLNLDLTKWSNQIIVPIGLYIGCIHFSSYTDEPIALDQDKSGLIWSHDHFPLLQTPIFMLPTKLKSFFSYYALS